MVVVDTSALAAVLVGGPVPAGLRDRLGTAELHAPHLLDTEMLSVLRRLVVSQSLGRVRAQAAREDLDDLSIIRYPHKPLGDRVWALRDNLTAYDATFVALAERLGAPLVTCDGRLARSRGHTAMIEYFDPSSAQ